MSRACTLWALSQRIEETARRIECASALVCHRTDAHAVRFLLEVERQTLAHLYPQRRQLCREIWIDHRLVRSVARKAARIGVSEHQSSDVGDVSQLAGEDLAGTHQQHVLDGRRPTRGRPYRTGRA